MLEGWCRFGVQELISNSSYKSAHITHLDRKKAEMEQAEKDPEVQVLSRQFKAVAEELISLLEQNQKSFGRTKVILESWPAYRLADVFVANFEVSFEEISLKFIYDRCRCRCGFKSWMKVAVVNFEALEEERA